MWMGLEELNPAIVHRPWPAIEKSSLIGLLHRVFYTVYTVRVNRCGDYRFDQFDPTNVKLRGKNRRPPTIYQVAHTCPRNGNAILVQILVHIKAVGERIFEG